MKPKNYSVGHHYQLKAARIKSNFNMHLNELETKGAQLQSEVGNTDLSSSLPPLSPFHSHFSSVFYLLLVFI